MAAIPLKNTKSEPRLRSFSPRADSSGRWTVDMVVSAFRKAGGGNPNAAISILEFRRAYIKLFHPSSSELSKAPKRSDILRMAYVHCNASHTAISLCLELEDICEDESHYHLPPDSPSLRACKNKAHLKAADICWKYAVALPESDLSSHRVCRKLHIPCVNVTDRVVSAFRKVSRESMTLSYFCMTVRETYPQWSSEGDSHIIQADCIEKRCVQNSINGRSLVELSVRTDPKKISLSHSLSSSSSSSSSSSEDHSKLSVPPSVHQYSDLSSSVLRIDGLDPRLTHSARLFSQMKASFRGCDLKDLCIAGHRRVAYATMAGLREAILLKRRVDGAWCFGRKVHAFIQDGSSDSESSSSSSSGTGSGGSSGEVKVCLALINNIVSRKDMTAWLKRLTDAVVRVDLEYLRCKKSSQCGYIHIGSSRKLKATLAKKNYKVGDSTVTVSNLTGHYSWPPNWTESQLFNGGRVSSSTLVSSVSAGAAAALSPSSSSSSSSSSMATVRLDDPTLAGAKFLKAVSFCCRQPMAIDDGGPLLTCEMSPDILAISSSVGGRTHPMILRGDDSSAGLASLSQPMQLLISRLQLLIEGIQDSEQQINGKLDALKAIGGEVTRGGGADSVGWKASVRKYGDGLKIASLRESVEKIKSDKKQVQVYRQALQAFHQSQTRSMHKAMAEMEPLVKKEGVLSDKLRGLNKEISRVKAELKSLESQEQGLQKDLDVVTLRKSDLTDEIGGIRQRLEPINRCLVSLKSSISHPREKRIFVKRVGMLSDSEVSELESVITKQESKLRHWMEWQNWTLDDVIQWVCELEDGRYTQYTSNLNGLSRITQGSVLDSINDAILQLLGITDSNDRTTMLTHIEALKLRTTELTKTIGDLSSRVSEEGLRDSNDEQLSSDVKSDEGGTLTEGDPELADEDHSLCVICLDLECGDYACVPCGHRCLCVRCKDILKVGVDRCPICQTPLQMIIKLFKS